MLKVNQLTGFGGRPRATPKLLGFFCPSGGLGTANRQSSLFAGVNEKSIAGMLQSTTSGGPRFYTVTHAGVAVQNKETSALPLTSTVIAPPATLDGNILCFHGYGSNDGYATSMAWLGGFNIATGAIAYCNKIPTLGGAAGGYQAGNSLSAKDGYAYISIYMGSFAAGYSLMKYNSQTGAVAWVKSFKTVLGTAADYLYYIGTMTLNPVDGNLYCATSREKTGGSYTVISKWDTSGNLLAQVEATGLYTRAGGASVCAPDGSIYFLITEFSPQYTTLLKFNTSLTLQWAKRINGIDCAAQSSMAMCGDAVVVYMPGATDSEIAIFAADGTRNKSIKITNIFDAYSKVAVSEGMIVFGARLRTGTYYDPGFMTIPLVGDPGVGTWDHPDFSTYDPVVSLGSYSVTSSTIAYAASSHVAANVPFTESAGTLTIAAGTDVWHPYIKP